MVTPEDFIAALRAYNGVKFHHQGRSSKGVDCVGLMIKGAMDCGISHGSERINGYGRFPTDVDFRHWAASFTKRQPYNRLQRLQSQVQLGDLLTFWIDDENITRHIAAYTGLDASGSPCMIHSYARENRGVIETVIDPHYWTRRITGIFRLREFC